MTIASLEEAAARQFGVFTWAQGLENVTERTLRYHGQPGRRWRRVAPGVYVVRAAKRDWQQPLVAAQLWAGADGVLSHRSAAALFGLDGAELGAVDFCLPRSTRVRKGWTVYRRAVDPGRVRPTLDGLVRVTDPLLTLADLGRVTADAPYEWAVESALRRPTSGPGRAGPFRRRARAARWRP